MDGDDLEHEMAKLTISSRRLMRLAARHPALANTMLMLADHVNSAAKMLGILILEQDRLEPDE